MNKVKTIVLLGLISCSAFAKEQIINSEVIIKNYSDKQHTVFIQSAGNIGKKIQKWHTENISVNSCKNNKPGISKGNIKSTVNYTTPYGGHYFLVTHSYGNNLRELYYQYNGKIKGILCSVSKEQKISCSFKT